jgi:hypothetical protein
MPADRSSRKNQLREGSVPTGPIKGETQAQALAAIKAEYAAEQKEMERQRLKAVAGLPPTADRRIPDQIKMGSNLHSSDVTLGMPAPTGQLKDSSYKFPNPNPTPLSAKGKTDEAGVAAFESRGPHESTTGRGRRRLKKTAGRRRRSRRNSLSAMLGKPLKMLMGKKTRKYRSRRH